MALVDQVDTCIDCDGHCLVCNPKNDQVKELTEVYRKAGLPIGINQGS